MVKSSWVYDFDNYRLFLRSAYLSLKSSNSKFSFRFIARAAGYKSASALQDIISGKKNLSLEGAQRFAKALKLNANETKYFKTLVLFNQAIDSNDKIKFAKELSQLKIDKSLVSLNENQYRLFENWYYPAVAELVVLEGFVENFGWIAKHVVPNISPAQAEAAVRELLRLEILVRDENGKLRPKDLNVTTPDEVFSAYVAHWHRECMDRASESIDTAKREERDISGTYFSISEKGIPKIKEIIQRFRKEILDLASQESQKDTVLQLSIQLFPLAKTQIEKSKG